MTTTILNTKISEVEKKITSAGGLVKKKTDYDANTKDGGKYFTTADCNKFTSDILDVKVKEKNIQ